MDALLEAGLEKLTVVFPEITEHPKVRAIHPRDKHEREIFTAPLFYLPRTKNTAAIGVNENAGNQLGMVGPLPITAVTLLNFGGIQLLDNVVEQIAFMIVG